MNTTPTAFTVDDLYALSWLEDVRISPDGRFAVYVQVSVDRPNNSYRRALHLISTAGGPPRRFSRGKSDYQPRWSPDGRRLAFVSTRDDEKGQVYLIDLAGGEAQQLTAMPNGASDPAWSPDGRRLAFIAPTNEEEQQREQADPPTQPVADRWSINREREQRRHDEELRRDPLIVQRLPYRSGTSFFDDRRRHIYLVDLPDGDMVTLPSPRRLSHGDLHYSPPRWMPDGQTLLTTATRDPEADSLFAYTDLLRLPIDGGEPLRLTSPGFSYTDPQPSPDGRLIACCRFDEQQLLVDLRVACMPAAGGEVTDLTAHIDLRIEQFRWGADSQSILYSAGWQGNAHIHTIGLPGTADLRHATTLVSGRRIVSEFDSAKDGSIVFIAGGPDNPCDLFLRTPDGTERRLTSINDELLRQRLIAPMEEFRFRAPDAQEVQGWVVYPPDFDPTQTYPLAVHIHGGPHVMWGPGYRSMWHEWQVTAASGYVVFFCNPRGSDGYGLQWRDALKRSWGMADSPDILAGVNALLAHGSIDPQRIAVTGGSYGGYMTAWLLAHSKRFVCGVAARGVYNLISQHSTSDAYELIEIEFHGFPWERANELWTHSPLAHAHNITAPLLILHSELDFRVPISEAEQLFTFLRRQKKVVELVRYPREGHELTRSGEPNHRADHMRRTLAWFDRYCKTLS